MARLGDRWIQLVSLDVLGLVPSVSSDSVVSTVIFTLLIDPNLTVGRNTKFQYL